MRYAFIWPRLHHLTPYKTHPNSQPAWHGTPAPAARHLCRLSNQNKIFSPVGPASSGKTHHPLSATTTSAAPATTSPHRELSASAFFFCGFCAFLRLGKKPLKLGHKNSAKNAKRKYWFWARFSMTTSRPCPVPTTNRCQPGRLRRRALPSNPKGILAQSPTVARHELPWVSYPRRFQPHRDLRPLPAHQRQRRTSTPAQRQRPGYRHP